MQSGICNEYDFGNRQCRSGENLITFPKFVALIDIPTIIFIWGITFCGSYFKSGKLELRIPWSNLGREPVVIVIDQVFLLVEPKYEWDATAHGMRQQAIKQAKLAAAEMLAEQRLLGDLEQNFQFQNNLYRK